MDVDSEFLVGPEIISSCTIVARIFHVHPCLQVNTNPHVRISPTLLFVLYFDRILFFAFAKLVQCVYPALARSSGYAPLS
jgi:hypothetical protein